MRCRNDREGVELVAAERGLVGGARIERRRDECPELVLLTAGVVDPPVQGARRPFIFSPTTPGAFSSDHHEMEAKRFHK